MARYDGGQARNERRGLRDGLDDFRPSRNRRNRGCLAAWDLAGTISRVPFY
jgi:hypothetical protein